jgi:archaemetzincin
VTLRIVPVGEEIAIELLDDIAAVLAQRLGLSCRVTLNRLDAGFAWDAKRNQYWSTALLRQLLAAYPEDNRILGVTGLDLYVPVLTFVFGEAQVGGRAAIVSTQRLRNELYGLPPDGELLLERLAKEAIHELGHTYGLRHCDDWRCVMASSHSVEKLDTKEAAFCEACRGRLNLAVPPAVTGTVP